MIKVLLTEDNDIVRRGLVRAISSRQGFKIVGQADCARKAVQLLEEGLETDILLTDLYMPDMDGVELAQHLQQNFPQIKTIILTMHSRPEYAVRARSAGVHGYVMKHVDLDELFTAISAVSRGRSIFPLE
jgi:DNA-binding NarL/FixJ family response regulator